MISQVVKPISHGEANRCLANMPKVGITIIIVVWAMVMILNGGDSSVMC